jgi:hypothetical protein
MSSTDNQIINATTFNFANDAKYVKPKTNKSGGKMVGILNSHTNKPLYLSTPLMLTWGVNEFTDEVSGRKSFDLAIQFPKDEYSNDATKAFLNNMLGFQEKLKEDCVNHSKEWMNKSKMTPEVVDALFHPMLKYPKDQETGEPDMTRPPTLKIKLDYWEDTFNCEIYDLTQKPLFQPGVISDYSPMELIGKGSNVAVVIRCGGLWFANGKFGCTWKLVQAVVKPKESMTGKCFIRLQPDEVAKLESQEDNDDHDIDAVGIEVAEDSDDEDAEKEAVALEPEPEPEPEHEKPKKKVVRKKKGAE